jgi:CRP-like cAMP-binding protein
MRSDLLDALGATERAALVGCLRPRRFRRGQVLFNEGDRGDSMHLLQQGRLAVEASTGDGGVIVLRVVNPGELVGELALLRPGHRRTGRVSALEPAETLVLQRSDFQRLRNELPGIDRFLTEALADRVIRTSQLATEMLLPAEIRIWRRLAVLAEAYGPDPIRLSQDTLAHAAGTVRQTANRVVQAGVRDGVLASGRGVISVLDPAAVDRRCAVPGVPPVGRT